MTCLACERIKMACAGDNPCFVAGLDETIMVLADEQRYEGWCTFLLKEHQEHMADLSIERQQRIFSDVARGAEAIRKVFGPRRLNYECLGNEMHHIHWHVIPRHAWDPQPTATIWVRPAEERAVSASPERLGQMVAALRKALAG